MNSESPPEQNKPFQTDVLLKTGLPRTVIDDLVNTISDGFYATSYERTTDQSGFVLTFFSLGAPDLTDLRGRLVLATDFGGYDDIEIADITSHETLDKNWLEEVHQAFPTRIIGHFFLFGSHFTGKPDPGFIPLQIDAATAFGSGEHETTQLCLETLSDFKEEHQFSKVLDMGCGSGVLGIAAQKLWPDSNCFGIDNDAESVRVSTHHKIINKTPNIVFEHGDGYNALTVYKNAPFDLILANILTRPLISMAPDAARTCRKGGMVVLSGLLDRQKDKVIHAYKNAGFIPLSEKLLNNWACLLLRKV